MKLIRWLATMGVLGSRLSTRSGPRYPHNIVALALISPMLRMWFAAFLTASLAGCVTTGPAILSEYQSMFGALGPSVSFRRAAPHSGVDFGGNYGDPVLAAADGTVSRVDANPYCGNRVVIAHKFERYTAYCHLQRATVAAGEAVRRGQVIGEMGDTGDAADCRRVRPCPHVHFELNANGVSNSNAIPNLTFNPLEHSGGCFDEKRAYPEDRLVLTHPVACKQ